MISLKTVREYLDGLLELDKIPADHSNNGLQVEACVNVKNAVFGVDACLELFTRAAELNADFIFVHHGLSWGAEPKRFCGLTGARLKLLFNKGISLYAAHLPLDAHPVIGHNAKLADMISLAERRMFYKYDESEIGVAGSIPDGNTVTAEQLADIYAAKLNCRPVVYGNAGRKIKNVGIVSGGAGMGGIAAAGGESLDCFITGEVEHCSYHIIKELKIPVISLGHYKSETPGVLAIMDKVQWDLGLECVFVDIPTGL